ncbi:hypothetical protein ARMSODRAFT_983001 [Armillaria solidipes]|uniref:Uncharacterized protein n=1 Tax=Armillaria solidipes TaxID=1076256 RepID=A0A2H3ARZ8_9AGAR|nr:hypothetical protein ARMSODRAFT_983001 [Armillaria solidipes]
MAKRDTCVGRVEGDRTRETVREGGDGDKQGHSNAKQVLRPLTQMGDTKLHARLQHSTLSLNCFISWVLAVGIFLFVHPLFPGFILFLPKARVVFSLCHHVDINNHGAVMLGLKDGPQVVFKVAGDIKLPCKEHSVGRWQDLGLIKTNSRGISTSKELSFTRSEMYMSTQIFEPGIDRLIPSQTTLPSTLLSYVGHMTQSQTVSLIVKLETYPMAWMPQESG